MILTVLCLSDIITILILAIFIKTKILSSKNRDLPASVGKSTGDLRRQLTPPFLLVFGHATFGRRHAADRRFHRVAARH
jgi:hypothetical protein